MRDFIESDRRPIVQQLARSAGVLGNGSESRHRRPGNGFDVAPEFLRARLDRNAAA